MHTLKKNPLLRLLDAGRATFISFVISSIPTYTLMGSSFPKRVHEDIEKLKRRFRRGGDEKRRALHLVSWDAVCMPKRYGGLSLRCIEKHNAVLLQKTEWRFLTEPDSRRVRTLKEKYKIVGDVPFIRQRTCKQQLNWY